MFSKSNLGGKILFPMDMFKAANKLQNLSELLNYFFSFWCRYYDFEWIYADPYTSTEKIENKRRYKFNLMDQVN